MCFEPSKARTHTHLHFDAPAARPVLELELPVVPVLRMEGRAPTKGLVVLQKTRE